MYAIMRLLDIVQPAVLAILHTQKFDRLDKISRLDAPHQHPGPSAFDRLSSTAFSAWQGFVLYPVYLVVAIERHFRF